MPIPEGWDPATFKTEILAEVATSVNNTVNGANKAMKTDFAKMLEDFGKTFKPVAPEQKVDEPATGTVAELNGKILANEKKTEGILNELKEEREKRTKAEESALEAQRVSAVDTVIGGLVFPNDRARDQFRRATLPLVMRDEDGNLVVKGDKDTVVDFKSFLVTEHAESPHFQPATQRGGSGANGGRPAGKGTGFVYDPTMTASQIAALPAEQQADFRQQVADAVLSGNH